MCRFFTSLLFSLLLLTAAVAPTACTNGKKPERHTLVVLDPGHFHAALVQKTALPELNDTVYVYAPEGKELAQYLESIALYNTREVRPTSWVEVVYRGEDFLEKMLSEKKGDLVVLAGRNRRKAEYLLAAVRNGMHVLADKPLAIDRNGYALIEEAYRLAARNRTVIYELMTERHDALNRVEKALLADPALFGRFLRDTEDAPAVSVESTHHFCKTVSGKPLRRPAWYYDVEEQGEGLADVTTHLVDLLFRDCFPGRRIRPEDQTLCRAGHSATVLSPEEFRLSTGERDFPPFLGKYLREGKLEVFSNGEMVFALDSLHLRLKVTWNFRPPEGGGDLFSSVKKGTHATLFLKQDARTHFQRELYVCLPEGREASAENMGRLRKVLDRSLAAIRKAAPDLPVTAEPDPDCPDRLHLLLPPENRPDHEAHFGLVVQAFLDCVDKGGLPAGEASNTLSKYHLLTEAVRMARAGEEGPDGTGKER